MRPTSTRLVRRVLLAVLVLVAGAVAWSLRRPATVGAPEPAATAASTQGTTVLDGSLMRFREGRRKIEVKWRSMVGQEGSAMRLQGVEVSVPYVFEAKASKATITADECLYEPDHERARFRGHVHVVTSDGFELETEGLDYLGEKGMARSEEDVTFRRAGTSGSGHGLEYSSSNGSVELRSNVRLRFEDEAGPPTEIEAGWANLVRAENVVRFENGATVRQGGRQLRSRRLQLMMIDDFRSIERAVAIEDVDLRMAGAQTLPGVAPTGGGGEKWLRCRRLNILFRSKGILEEASAVGGASLEILPGPRDPRERRQIVAQQLLFRFDEQGRLTSLRGFTAGAPEPTVLTADPLPPGPGGQRRVQSRQFTASLDPEDGVVHSAEFQNDVVFSEPGRKAWAKHASFDDTAGRLALDGSPRILDEDQGSDLRGKRIEIETRTQNVSASGNVRHTLTRERRQNGAGMLSGEEPTIVVCRQFDYEAATKTARYRDEGLLRSGADEIRAPLIVIREPTPEARSLAASGGVASVLHPRREQGAAKDPPPVAARSRELLYEERTNLIVYSGDVEIRQGDILTKSPKAVVTLTADGATVDHMVAGEPVEVQQGLRRATGRQGTYTPQNETFVLVGDKVVVLDVDRHVEGRIVTFQVGKDRIRVDGREEERTEAVFKQKGPPKP
jgi:lipopolysaccharide transport protein LptA/LPS export ABC transporter protein LptC